MNVVVVAGASGTIGGAIARRFVARGDCRVIGTARNVEALAAMRSAAFLPLALDVMTGKGLDQLIEVIGGDRVSMFVSAVGGDLDIPSGEVTVFGVTELLVRHDVELKVHGFLRVLHAIEGHFESGAAIVGIGGNLGAEPLGDTGGVGAADAALSNLVRQMSKSVSSSTYSFHVVAPGPVRSPRIEHLIDSAEAHAKASGQPFDRAAMSSALLLIDADDVAWLVETLYAGPASRMNGGTLTIDNGLRMGTP
jgi:NAD(P)-dependent dehydrogenase (short-subunit alcohol dehydrogenase family)